MWLISYWVFPMISACMWVGMMAAMFGTWEAQGSPHYPSMEANQNIAYISDVGAYGLKPLFITGSVITTIFLDLAFVSERWLRHTGRLAHNTSKTQKVLSIFSILFAILGSAGLILLSIFDTYHHPKLHDGFLLLFIVGYVVSAMFICAEYQRLGIHYRNHRIIRISFWTKLVFIMVEVVLAIVFVATNFTNVSNVAAIFEWIVALVFTGYILSFLLDLIPSVRTKNHVPQGFREGPRIEKTRDGDVVYESNLTTDSQGPNANGGYRGTAPNGYGDVERNGNAPTNGFSDVPLNGNELKGKKKGFGRLHF